VADIQSDKAHAPAGETAGSRLAAKRAAKAAKKAASRGTSNPAEEVAKSVQTANAWIEAHGKKVWIALGAAVAVAVAVLGIASLKDGKSREAGALLRTAVTTNQGIIVAPEDTPPEDPILPTFTSAKERDEKALAQYRDVQKQYPDSTAARYAALGEANILLGLGKPAEASAVFEKLRTGDERDSAKDDYLRFRALEGAGYALEAQQKYAEAAERFEALSKLKNGAYRKVGEYHRARMLVLQGKRDEARKVLEALDKAAADKPAEGEAEPAAGDSFEFATTAAQTLLQELGGQPSQGAAAGGISQSVLDSLRRQLGAKKQ